MVSSKKFHIRVNANNLNKDEGFYTLMTSGSSAVCLRGDEYIITDEAKKKLDKKRVQYEFVKERT